MATIGGYLNGDLAHCNGLFGQAEACVERGQWAQAGIGIESFGLALERHLAMEEQVMFRAFEQAIGSDDGPTKLMRKEHKYLRGIIQRLSESISQHQANDFFGHAETWHITMRQHNLKEVDILYPLADRLLAARQSEIIGAMDALCVAAQQVSLG